MKIPINELIKDLGYRHPEKLGNYVREIIKKYNDFKEFYIDQNDKLKKRPEKFVVDEEKAKCLIDNLCILRPYKKIFPRSTDKNPSSPFDLLKKGMSEKDLKKRGQNLYKILNENKIITEKSLSGLDLFLETIGKHKIDIREDSLRDLLMENAKKGQNSDFLDSYELSNWNDLIHLEYLLETEGESSDLYKKIGKIHLDRNDKESAIDAFVEATNLNKDDLESWRYLSQLYWDLLNQSKKMLTESLVLSDFRGIIDNPISSEEFHGNDLYEMSKDDIHKFHSSFIDAAIHVLEGQSDNINNPFKKDILFYQFITTVERSDLNQTTSEKILRILKSKKFIDNDYIFTVRKSSVEIQLFFTKWVELYSWIDIDLMEKILKPIIKYMETNESFAYESINLLSRSEISNILWEYLGADKFKKLYSKCREYEHQNQIFNEFRTYSEIPLSNILSLFSFSKIISHNKNDRPFLYYDIEKAENAIKESLKYTEGWRDLLNHDLWKENPYNNGLYCLNVYILISVIIEILNGKTDSLHDEVIQEFMKRPEVLKFQLRNIETFFDIGFFSEHYHKKLIHLFEFLRNLYDEFAAEAYD